MHLIYLAKWLTRIKLAKAMHALKGGEAPAIEAGKNGRNPFPLYSCLGQESREKGINFFKLGNIEGALNAFTQALEFDSQDVM